MSQVSKQVHDFRVATISQIVGSLWKLQEKGRKMIPNFEKVKSLSSIYDSNMLQLCFFLLDYSGTFKQQVYRSRGRGEFPDHRVVI